MSDMSGILKIVVITLISLFLYGFSNSEYSQRKLSDSQVMVYPVDQPFIDHTSVNNLLIQNSDDMSSTLISALDLIKLEQGLKNHQMVKDASVFVTLDGVLSAKVYQRQPVARLITDSSFVYIDKKGQLMPTSENFSARVPIAYGFKASDLEKCFPVFNKIYNDDFYKKLITQISLKNDSSIVLATRLDNFAIHLGKPINLTRKLANFKAFYQYLKKKDQLKRYEKIDLRFGKQVIASKN